MFPLLLLPFLLAGGCAPGENSLLNPGSHRQGLSAPPETVRIGSSRMVEQPSEGKVPAGHLSTLILASSDTVQSTVYLRFGSLPDTAGVTGAILGFRLRVHEGSLLRAEAFAVDSLAEWTEDTIGSSTQPELPYDPEVLSESGDLSPLPGDSIDFQPGVAQIPASLIRTWARHPATGGLALRLTGSPPGSVFLYSREAVLDTTGVANPRLRLLQGTTVYSDVSPTADGFSYVDARAPILTGGPVLPIGEWLPARILFRFQLPDTTVLPRGTTVNRALLTIHFDQPTTDSTKIPLAVYRATTDWTGVPQKDSVGVGERYGVESSPAVVDSAGWETGFDIAPMVQLWMDGTDPNYGTILRATDEGALARRLYAWTTEAPDSALRPVLDLIFTRPQDPRWVVGAGQP